MNTTKLIIINGPAGVGKSTLASHLHASLPLSVYVDIDVVRRMISDYGDHRKESGFLAFELAHGIIEEALKNDHAVIIDKMMYGFVSEERTTNILDDYVLLGEKYKVKTHEFILWAQKEIVQKRAHERGFCETRILTPAKVDHFWDRINEYKDTRPHAHIIDTSDMSQDDVYTEVRRITAT